MSGNTTGKRLYRFSKAAEELARQQADHETRQFLLFNANGEYSFIQVAELKAEYGPREYKQLIVRSMRNKARATYGPDYPTDLITERSLFS